MATANLLVIDDFNEALWKGNKMNISTNVFMKWQIIILFLFINYYWPTNPYFFGNVSGNSELIFFRPNFYISGPVSPTQIPEFWTRLLFPTNLQPPIGMVSIQSNSETKDTCTHILFQGFAFQGRVWLFSFLVHYYALSVVPPSLTFHIFKFSSETAEQNSMKLDRKQDLNVLYQVCVFWTDKKNKMAASTSD